MLATTPVTLTWAWRLRRAAGDKNRFFVAFLDGQTTRPFAQSWTCDGIARSEDEARAYAMQFGVSAGNFAESLKHVRKPVAARSLFL